MSEIADEEGSDLMIDLAAAQIHSLSCAGCLFGALRRIINGLQRRFIHKNFPRASALENGETSPFPVHLLFNLQQSIRAQFRVRGEASSVP